MARKKANIHYLYKTTCIITGRWYIGMHSTCNIDDGYMGSGKILRYSIRKYGKDNHVVEILEFFETRELLIEAEIKTITEDILIDKNCMNLAEGGSGGHGSRFLTKEQLIKGAEVTNEKYKDKLIDWRSKGGRINFELNGDTLEGHRFDWNGKKHSEETKEKIRESMKGKYDGLNHPQYGTCWITKDGDNKKIKKEEIYTYLNEGWVKGRKIKL